MATGTYGLSFVPGSQNNGNAMESSLDRGPRQAPVQQAIKILSMRPPKFYGSQALAPQALLNAPGGMGQPAARGNVTAQALASLAGLPPTMTLPQSMAPQIPTLSGDRGTDTTRGWMQGERDLNRPSMAPTLSAAPIAGFAPGTPHFTPGQTTDGGPVYAPPGEWIDPRPSLPEPVSAPSEPTPQASPWERPGRNETLARKYLEMLDQFGFGGFGEA